MLDVFETDFDAFHDNFLDFIGVTDYVSIEHIQNWFQLTKYSNIDYQGFYELFNVFFIGDKRIYDNDIRKCFEYFDKNKDNQLDSVEFNDLINQIFEPFINPRAALIIIDVQNDFINGSLALKNCSAKEDGEEVIPVINNILTQYLNNEFQFKSIVYTYDWHPTDHISFFDNIHCRRISQHSPISLPNVKPLDTVIIETDSGEETDQILWPKHCVENSKGAALHKDLMVVDGAYHLKKGIFSNVDSYSAFGLNHPKTVTELDNQLKLHNINILFICGLATDVCVAQTSFDGLKLGYRVVVVKDACRGVDQTNIDNIQDKLIANQAVIITTPMISHIINGKVRPVQLAVVLIRKIITDKN